MELQKLPGPAKYDLKFLRDWLANPKRGNNFLEGIEATVWLEENSDDLVAVSSRRTDPDPLTKWISDSVFPWLFKHFGVGKKVGSSPFQNQMQHN
jgi:hypothetical protein